MKRLLVIGALASVLSTAHASKVDDCFEISRAATSIMESRQAGVPITRVLQLAQEAQNVKLLETIIFEAYGSSPKYPDARMATDAIERFEIRWVSWCYHEYN